MKKFWIETEGDTMMLFITTAEGRRALSRTAHVDPATEADWRDWLADLGYRDGTNPDLDRWVVVTEYNYKGMVKAVVLDAQDPGTTIPESGEFAKVDRYVDRFDTLAEAEAFRQEAIEA